MSCPDLGLTMDALEVILAALGVILTALVIGIAILTWWGYRDLKQAAIQKATEVAVDEVKKYLEMADDRAKSPDRLISKIADAVDDLSEYMAMSKGQETRPPQSNQEGEKVKR
jgi:hypothetical protein